MDNGTSDLLKTQAAGQHFFCIGRAAVILKAMVERAEALGMKTYTLQHRVQREISTESNFGCRVDSRWKNG